jgi:hypothetical protein
MVFVNYLPGIRLQRKYTPRQITVANAVMALRTTAKTGMTGALRRNPRRTAAKDPAKRAVKAGRQSCLRSDTISGRNNPSAGARRNHDIASGKNAAPIRGRKDKPASPCVAKPMKVMRVMARRSPRMRIRLFMREKN